MCVISNGTAGVDLLMRNHNEASLCQPGTYQQYSAPNSTSFLPTAFFLKTQGYSAYACYKK